jgi:hypothetical protein
MNLSMFSAVAPLLTTSPIIITFAASLPERLRQLVAWIVLTLAVLLTGAAPVVRRSGGPAVARTTGHRVLFPANAQLAWAA